MSDGIEKIGPGKWKARITWHDAQGKKHDTDRTIKADTKAQAVVERERIREELAGSGDEWTVEQAIAEWLPSMRSGSRQSRDTHARRFKERFGTLRLSRVPPAEVQRWLAALDVSDLTANAHRASLLALYKFSKSKGRLCGANPITQTVRRLTPRTNAEWLEELEGPVKRRALVGQELPRFFAAMLAKYPRLYPMMRCQLLLGCRWSEASALQWRDIDWETGVVTIRRCQQRDGDIGPPKGKKARDAALGPEGLAFMRGHRAAMEREGWPGHETWCFPRPITHMKRRHDMWPYSTVYEFVCDVMHDLGIDLACATHAMRHSYVTLARALESDAVDRAAAGKALRDTVGHSSERVTEGYTDRSHRKAVAASFATQLESRIAPVFGDVVQLKKRRK